MKTTALTIKPNLIEIHECLTVGELLDELGIGPVSSHDFLINSTL